MAAATEVLTPLSPEELRKMNAYWRACNYLVSGHDLSSRQSPSARTAEAGAHQEPAAWVIGVPIRASRWFGFT